MSCKGTLGHGPTQIQMLFFKPLINGYLFTEGAFLLTGNLPKLHTTNCWSSKVKNYEYLHMTCAQYTTSNITVGKVNLQRHMKHPLRIITCTTKGKECAVCFSRRSWGGRLCDEPKEHLRGRLLRKGGQQWYSHVVMYLFKDCRLAIESLCS